MGTYLEKVDVDLFKKKKEHNQNTPKINYLFSSKLILPHL